VYIYHQSVFSTLQEQEAFFKKELLALQKYFPDMYDAIGKEYGFDRGELHDYGEARDGIRTLPPSANPIKTRRNPHCL